MLCFFMILYNLVSDWEQQNQTSSTNRFAKFLSLAWWIYFLIPSTSFDTLRSLNRFYVPPKAPTYDLVRRNYIEVSFCDSSRWSLGIVFGRIFMLILTVAMRILKSLHIPWLNQVFYASILISRNAKRKQRSHFISALWISIKHVSSTHSTIPAKIWSEAESYSYIDQ